MRSAIVPANGFPLEYIATGLAVVEADAQDFLRVAQNRTRCFGRDRLLIGHCKSHAAVLHDAHLDREPRIQSVRTHLGHAVRGRSYRKNHAPAFVKRVAKRKSTVGQDVPFRVKHYIP